jgi:carboxypeptidase family protein/Big-like domain-containing protein
MAELFCSVHVRRDLSAFRTVLAVCVTLAAVGLAACGGSPSKPSTTSTTTTSSAPSVTAVAVTGAGQGTPGQTAQLTATATLSDGSTQNVTPQATWESSNTGVATVSPAGLVTFVAAGVADIRATYRSVTGSARITVSPAQRPRHGLSGVLTDQINGRGVDQARVEVVNGLNAGRFVTTPADGTYAFADLFEDSFTVRFTSPFYETAERAVTLTADTRLDVAMRPNTDVSPFYGTFNVNLSVSQQNCEFPVVPGNTGQLTLAGNRDGTNFTATIVERGTTRSYGGRMQIDGSFNGNGGGVIAGIARALTAGSLFYPHDYTGSMQGRVTGRSVSGTENVVFGAPCPGRTLTIAFSGSK